MKKELLLVDDKAGHRNHIGRYLRLEGYAVETAESGNDALEKFAARSFPVVITDLLMKNGGGLDVLAGIKDHHATAQVIILTGQGNLESAVKSLKLKAFDFVSKGPDTMLPALLETVERAFAEYDKLMDTNQTKELVRSIRVLDQNQIRNLNVADAIQLLELKLGDESADFETRKKLGLLLYSLCRFDRAENHFQVLLETASDDAETLYFLGNICMQRGADSKAIHYLLRALEADPAYGEAHYSLGVVYGRRGDSNAALICFKKASSDPNYRRTLRSIGVAYGELAEYDRALVDFQEKMEIPHQEMRGFLCHLSMALIYRHQKSYGDAIPELKAALAISKNDAFVLLVTGMVYREWGDQQNYRSYFIKAFNADPKFAFGIYEIETQKAQKLRRAEIMLESRNNMLSYLSHTMRNTLAGGPPLVDQTLRFIKEMLGEGYENKPAYRTFTNLGSLHHVFDSMSEMLDTFRLLSTSPEIFASYWQKDQTPEISNETLLDYVLKQVCTRLFFEDPLLDQRKILAEGVGGNLKELRTSFMNEVLVSDMKDSHQKKAAAWLRTCFPIIKTVVLGPARHFSKAGIRFNFLFSCISEMLYNAVKYTDGSHPITLEWISDQDENRIRCLNHFNLESSHAAGTGKGLDFIQSLTGMADGFVFQVNRNLNQFETMLIIKTKLLCGGNREHTMD